MQMKFEPLTDSVSVRMMMKCQGGLPSGEIKVTPPGIIMPRNYQNCAEKILNMDIREDDVWVLSFPKSGATWVQEMVWLLGNNLDFDTARKQPLHERFPLLEFQALNREGMNITSTETVEKMPSPRYIKSHLPLQLLPKQIWTKKPKMIYVCRNPKDAAISFFRHFCIFNNYSGTEEEFLEAFIEDKVISCPYWDHVLKYWKLSNETNFIFLQHEGMKNDLMSVMKQVADFLNIKLTEEDEKRLLKYLRFPRSSSKNFENFRISRLRSMQEADIIEQEESGTFKCTLNPEISAKFESWVKKNVANTDFPNLSIA